MKIRGYAFYVVIVLASFLLSSCISSIWTTATIAYDRHNVYKKVSDFDLGAQANRALYRDREFKRPDCGISVAVLNGDVLLTGHVPTAALRKEAEDRVAVLGTYRRLFNEIEIHAWSTPNVQDAWTTTKVRTAILADSDINPHVFKVVSSDHVVYLMGDVLPDQADKVINIARKCAGVKRVVTLMKYYNLSDRPVKS